MDTEYEFNIRKWKEKHGIHPYPNPSQDDLLMAAEESTAKGKSWCFGCDKKMPIREMKLITRRIDSYCQCDESEGEYIAKENRVRMCPKCFEENYGQNDERSHGGVK